MTKENKYRMVDVAELRLGLYVDLDLGWLKHPFPSSSFRITSTRQIEILRSLGVPTVRTVPALCEPGPGAASEMGADADKRLDPNASTYAEHGTNPISVTTSVTGSPMSSVMAPVAGSASSPPPVVSGSNTYTPSTPNGVEAAAQQALLLQCERRFSHTADAFGQIQSKFQANPKEAAALGQATIQGLTADLLEEKEIAVQLLAGPQGDRAAVHAVNVTLLSLTLGRALGLGRQALSDLGLAALLHDIGKVDLPARVRWFDPAFSSAEAAMFKEHVRLGVDAARAMGLAPAVVQAIAQHHEMASGSGFPARLAIDAMATPGRILALVNHYDNLCNPPRPANAMTPHEALAHIFSRMKSQFDPAALGAFVKVMGVYPPGCMVQLVDERYAMVVSVNASRPLKPRVILQQAGVPRAHAQVVDLEHQPGMGIRRSLRPQVLPQSVLDYFAPPARPCFSFAPALQPEMPFQSM